MLCFLVALFINFTCNVGKRGSSLSFFSCYFYSDPKVLICVAYFKSEVPVPIISVTDPDPGSGAFLTPGSGIQNRFFPDP